MERVKRDFLRLAVGLPTRGFNDWFFAGHLDRGRKFVKARDKGRYAGPKSPLFEEMRQA